MSFNDSNLSVCKLPTSTLLLVAFVISYCICVILWPQSDCENGFIKAAAFSIRLTFKPDCFVEVFICEQGEIRPYGVPEC